jgi:ribonuclease HII
MDDNSSSSMIFGVDEAGKGPVLGPMVIAAVGATSKDVLPDGLKDSKKLTDSKREELADELRESDSVVVRTVSVSVERIDAEETDMNSLTVNGFSSVISLLPDDYTTGLLDASDTDETRFSRRVTEQLDNEYILRAEHNADENHPIVSAASIIAKSKREETIQHLNQSVSGEIGSGYPSDPTTRQFIKSYIKEYDELPPFARKSWKTSDDLLSEAGKQ